MVIDHLNGTAGSGLNSEVEEVDGFTDLFPLLAQRGRRKCLGPRISHAHTIIWKSVESSLGVR